LNSESVRADEVAPSFAEFDRIPVGCWLDLGPAQLGDVFDASSWPGLFPIDQPDGDAALDDDVSRL
jgi:hypothetical protein